MATACPHSRTRVIAQDEAATYLECLDCGAVFEPEELEGIRKEKAAGETPPFDESLSDA